MRTVSQPDAIPTNKLSAATLTAAIAAVLEIVVTRYFPHYADPTIWAPLGPVLAFVVGYFVKDRPNV
ncbi:hypothetical protein [Afifella pfennigii]|uniref:hypothetical protein n=1 Tax=Afifella pfennigii TaxID=209897 RepID=UPI00047EDB68|nr:hypothetical protein [Afifella pfennigii]